MPNETPPTSNRRVAARLACQLTARYRLEKQWHPATALNISSNGCRLRLGEDLARGSALSLSFEAPLKDGAKALFLEMAGTVIWCRHEGLSFQAGIQFTSAPPDAVREILAALG
jgi:PilZ domain